VKDSDDLITESDLRNFTEKINFDFFAIFCGFCGLNNYAIQAAAAQRRKCRHNLTAKQQRSPQFFLYDYRTGDKLMRMGKTI
jgi:hypothetical protein